MSTSGGATPADPLERQAAWLERYEPGIRIEEQGKVVSVGDGIAWIAGLPSVPVDEIVTFEDGSEAMVFDLTEGLVGVVLLHQSEAVTAGAPVRRTGRTLSMPVGDGLLGRVVDPLGKPLDGNPEPAHTRWQPLDAPAPGVAARDFVRSPVYTGIKIIDTMIPIGKGQRQLIIGDEGLGRSSIALDTVINQRGQNVYCIYVLIGQKRSTVVNTIELLRKHDALEYSTIIAAEASSRPGLQHLAPFAGCALAEFWMHQGRDVLIVYDDLTAHATTYRELSLLLRHPPGREAFPGDIFSVHARLLERATCLSAERGGGSMTALPIVATKLGEIAAYIPTNLISITDGQIYLERNLFSAGFRPAIDIAVSVSRIGGRAQHHRIKEEAGRMKLDYLQFLELEAFTRFGARLEASVEAAIRKGRVLREILKQERFSQLSKEQQLAWLIAFNDGQFDAEEPETLGKLFGAFEQSMQGITLELDSPREHWSSLVAERIAALRQAPA